MCGNFRQLQIMITKNWELRAGLIVPVLHCLEPDAMEFDPPKLCLCVPRQPSHRNKEWRCGDSVWRRLEMSPEDTAEWYSVEPPLLILQAVPVIQICVWFRNVCQWVDGQFYFFKILFSSLCELGWFWKQVVIWYTCHVCSYVIVMGWQWN